MLVLNLDSSFNPTSYPQVKYSVDIFPGGELHPKILQEINPFEEVLITHRIRDSRDLMLIVFFSDILKNTMGIKHLELFIPYLPYARQDKIIKKLPYESFTLKSFSEIINSIGFVKVYVLDPHSHVLKELIKNIISINSCRFVGNVIDHIEKYHKFHKELNFIIPDKGAINRVEEVSNYIERYYNRKVNLIQCLKHRDRITGKLSNFEVETKNINEELFSLVIDDICDGGGTFIEIAKILKPQIKNLNLFVSHGIFSQGIHNLLKYYNHIYTTDSFQTFNSLVLSNTRFTQFNLSL